jgi:hypothetical protein
MNQDFAVSNTTSDISHIGPLVQELSLDKDGCITLDQTLPANTGDQPLTIAAIKQASLGTSLEIRADPSGPNEQNLTIDLPAGAGAGTVASALVSQLGLTRQNNGVSINFVVYLPTTPAVNLTSTDPNVLGVPLTLYSAGGDGITTVGIELAMVGTATTPPVVRLVAKYMPFTCDVATSYVKVKTNTELPPNPSILVPFTSIGSGTWFTVILNQVLGGTLTGYDTTTGIFTAPEDAVYNFSASIRWLGTSGTPATTAAYNDPTFPGVITEFKLFNDFPDNNNNYVLNATTFLSSGTTYRLAIQNNGGVDRNYNPDATHLTITKLISCPP